MAKSYVTQKEISTPDGFQIPNWDQRGISSGYAKLVDYSEASNFIDSALQDMSMLGGNRMTLSQIVPGGGYQFGSGTVLAPGISWAADTDTGFYWISDGVFGVSANGVKIAEFNTSGGSFYLPSLTTGSVLFAGALGLVSQDNSNFFWDDTNNRLGLGNNSPQFTLDITGSERISNTLTLTPMTTGSVLFVGASHVVTQDNANFFWDDSNNRLGIGCNDPWRALEVRHASLPQLVLSTDANNAVIFQGSGNGCIVNGYSALWGGIPLFSVQCDTPGIVAEMSIYNTGSGAFASGAKMLVQIDSSATGDAYYQLYNGVTLWSFGLDNSDTDAFVLSKSATLGTTNRLKVDTTGNLYLPIYTTGSIPFIGASGQVLENNASLFWDNTSFFLQLGGGHQGTLRVKNDSGADTPFVILGGSAVFNTTRDDILFIGYNLSGPTGDTRIDTAEPAFKLGLEANYNNGATHFLEYNWDYMNSAGVGKQRALALGIDRTTDLYTWVFSGTNYYLTDNSGNNHFQFATPIGGAPVFTISYTDAVLYGTMSVDSSGFFKFSQNATNVFTLGQAGWFRAGNSGNSNSDPGKSTQIGYDTSLNIGFIQCADWATAFKPMKMNALEWRFYCNNTRLVNFFSGGDVGINQSTDRSVRLDVLDATNPQLRLTYTDNSVYTNFLTDSSGNLTITPSGGHILGPAGNASNPGYSFSGDPDTGMYSWAANLIGFAAGGVVVMACDASGFYPGTSISFQIGAGSTLSSSSDVLTIARGANAQQFRVMGNSTGSKYSVLKHDGTDGTVDVSSGKLIIGGTATDIQIGKALVALGGGAAPTLGTIGGSGPATAAQNTWLQLKDSAGNTFWVPAWK